MGGALAAVATRRTISDAVHRKEFASIATMNLALTGKRHDFRAQLESRLRRSGRRRRPLGDAERSLQPSADLSLGVCDRAMFHAGNGYLAAGRRDRSKKR